MPSPGETVVYRHHVCEIAALRAGYFEGEDYLELRVLFDKSLKLFVALKEAKPPTLRPVMSGREALALIDTIADAEGIDEEAFMPKANTPTLLDRRMREEYDRHLKTFSPEDLIPIMKSIHARTARREDAGRQITATDKKYFDLAEGLLCDELSVALDIPRDEVRDFLVKRVEKAEACERSKLGR